MPSRTRQNPLASRRRCTQRTSTLEVAEQTEEAKAQIGLVVSADTKANGLFTMTKALVDENITALKAAKLDRRRRGPVRPVDHRRDLQGTSRPEDVRSPSAVDPRQP